MIEWDYGAHKDRPDLALIASRFGVGPTVFNEDRESDRHLIPMCQEGLHAATRRCWCGPEVNYENHSTGGRVWMHHAADRPLN
jgi:hypothetical protein